LSRNSNGIAKALNESPGLGDRPVPERVIYAGPALPGPAPVIENTPENVAALAADLARKARR
jgi:hypothetical protein